MEISAKAKFLKISPKKIKPLLKDLRGRSVDEAMAALRYSPSKAGGMILKLVKSAAANAENNYNIKSENLRIKELLADDGPRYKRYWFRSRGSADILLKRLAHLSVTLEEKIPTDSQPKDKPEVKSEPSAKDKQGDADKGKTGKSKANEPTKKAEPDAVQSEAPKAPQKPEGKTDFPNQDTKKKKRMDIGRIFRRTTSK